MKTCSFVLSKMNSPSVKTSGVLLNNNADNTKVNREEITLENASKIHNYDLKMKAFVSLIRHALVSMKRR